MIWEKNFFAREFEKKKIFNTFLKHWFFRFSKFFKKEQKLILWIDLIVIELGTFDKQCSIFECSTNLKQTFSIGSFISKSNFAKKYEWKCKRWFHFKASYWMDSRVSFFCSWWFGWLMNWDFYVFIFIFIVSLNAIPRANSDDTTESTCRDVTTNYLEDFVGHLFR